MECKPDGYVLKIRTNSCFANSKINSIPQTYKEDIYSSTLNMTVKAGDATGMSAVCYNNYKRRNNNRK